MDYRNGSHTVYQIEYHFVWVAKYRYQVMTGEAPVRVCALVKADARVFRERNRARNGELRPCTQLGECAAGDGAQRDHEADQGTNGDPAIQGFSAHGKEVLGPTNTGARIFLRDGATNHRIDD
jgi:hypothetical protein